MAAFWYDNNTKKHRLAEMKAYAEEAAKHIQDGRSVLEVAPGPGHHAIEAAKLSDFEIIGWISAKILWKWPKEMQVKWALKWNSGRAVLQIFHFQTIRLISLPALLPLRTSKCLSKH